MVLLGFSLFHWVILCFTGISFVSLGFTGFHWVSLGFTGFHWVSLGFTVFLEVLLPVLRFFGATPYIKRDLNVLNSSNFFPVSYTHVCKILEKFVVKHWSYCPLKMGGSILDL